MSVALIDFDFTATFSGLFSVSMNLCSSTFVAHRANGLPTSNYACHPGLGDFEVSFITPTCSRYAFRLFAIGGNDVYAHVSMTLYFRSQVTLTSPHLARAIWASLPGCCCVTAAYTSEPQTSGRQECPKMRLPTY